MLKVYICEDIEVQRNRMTKIVENMIYIENFDMEIEVVTNDPDEILSVVQEIDEVGIYFLDIDLQTDMDGLELAKEIRKYDPRGFIIFVTTHSEMSFMTFVYKLEAMDFILKDEEDDELIGKRIHQCLLDANERYCSAKNKLQDIFSVKINDRIFTIAYDDIIFFETSDSIHRIILHGKRRVMEFYGKMRELEDQLDHRFYRCHRSFIVNTTNIKTIDFQNRVIHMVNGEDCLISSRSMKGLRDL